MRGDDQQWHGDPKKREPGSLYTTQPLNWPLPPVMQAVRQQYIEDYRDTRSRLAMVEMARWILKQQEAGHRTAAPSTVPGRLGCGDLLKHLKDVGVFRKSDAPSGGWYYIITPCARDWAMWIVQHEQKIFDPRWPDADPSADATPGKPHAGLGGATEDRTSDQSQRSLPPVGERPSREGRADGGDDTVFPCHRQ